MEGIKNKKETKRGVLCLVNIIDNGNGKTSEGLRKDIEESYKVAALRALGLVSSDS